MRNLFFCLFLGLIMLQTGCTAGAPNEEAKADIPLYHDVTESHLPYQDLTGLSMDAGVADLDGDGDLDIITSNSNGPSYREPSAYRIFLNDGTGFFAEAPPTFLPQGVQGSGFDIKQADFNGDGLPDLYLASRGTMDQLLFRQKDN